MTLGDNSSILARVSIVKDVFTYDWYSGAPSDYPLITEIDAGSGFAEITNPTAKRLDLSGWKLSTGAGELSIPARTTIAPGAALAIDIRQLSLDPKKDTLRLKKGQTTIDLVAWGADRPGWNLPALPLCRPAAGKDTDTALDWTRATRSTPGTPGCGK